MRAATKSGRMLATVLFTDIVGSTQLASELGDRRWGEVLDAHHASVREQIEKHDGDVVATAGDGFFASFDSPASAVECARAVRDAVRSLGLEVRAGLHTGECELMGDNVGGLAVHIGARVSAKAGPGQILVSSTVKDLVAGANIPFKDRGSHALKGLPGKWRLYAVDEQPAEKPHGKAKAEAIRAPLPGRANEIATIEQELEAALAGSLRMVSIEGEIGIGKTRLLDEIAAIARRRGFLVATAFADEEIRGPFLFTRTLLGALGSLATDPGSRRALKRAVDALSGGLAPEPSAPGLPVAERLIPLLDVITLALRSIAIRKPLVLLLDDLHFADDETLRLLRFVARFATSSHIAVAVGFEPGSGPAAADAAALAADLERLRIGQRLPLARLTAPETAEMLQGILGGPVDAPVTAALHEKGEGVPFHIEELARSLLDAGAIHSVDGTWTMPSAGASTVPTSVRSLVERRAARLPEGTRTALQIAAVLGRGFALRSLATVMGKVAGADPGSVAQLASLLAPAVEDGIVVELPATAPHDYRFSHNQIRAVLAEGLSVARRPAVHAAIVEMLSGEGEPPADRLAEVAHHAMLAGEVDTAERCALAAAKLALDALAPEEALRLLESVPRGSLDDQRRVTYLRLRDDALAAVGLGRDRAQTLDDLEVLAHSLDDDKLALEVDLRRAAAARMAEDYERAASIARGAAAAAGSRGDKVGEQAAWLEIGQALLRSPLGEAFTAPPSEIDLNGAAEAFDRAAAIAQELGDERGVAVAKRERGVIQNGRAKAAFLEYAMTKPRFELPNAEEWVPIDRVLDESKQILGEALDIFERLDDRRGVMSTIIALSYTHFHSGLRHGVAGVMEQIRRLHSRGPYTTQNERLADQMQTLYGIHYFARSGLIVDLALDRGGEAHRAARSLGDRWMEFLAAGGVALTHSIISETDEAERWLNSARSAAMADPTSLRARRLEMWRGVVRAAAGDAGGMIERFDRAAGLAATQGRSPEHCEVLATAALSGALMLVHGSGQAEVIARTEQWAEEALRLAAALAGQHPWTAYAQSARAWVLWLRGETENAAAAARAAFWNIQGRIHFSPQLETRLLLMRVLDAAGAEEAAMVKEGTRSSLQEVVLNIFDEPVKQRWFDSPLHRALEEMVGPVPPPPRPSEEGRERIALLTPREEHVLRFATSGMTNREIAAELGVPKATIDHDMDGIFGKLGVSSRASAATFALREGVV